MIRRYSTAFGSSPEAFKKAGLFDGFIGVDTKLYIDPHLLSASKEPEIIDASKRFRKYFEDLIRILKQAHSPTDIFWSRCRKKLRFREIPQLSLGYSKTNTGGSAIGPKLADGIFDIARQLVKAGIDDPELFELIGLLEDGIGADRISDMTARIVVEDLLAYTQRKVEELSLTSRSITYNNKAFQAPYDSKSKKG